MPNIITNVAQMSAAGAKLYGQNAAGDPGFLLASGFAVRIDPSGDETFVADSAAIQAAIDTLALAGGGVISLSAGIYYAKDVELKSGVSIVGSVYPAGKPNQACPDLGFSATVPFEGGSIFKGTGTETVFYSNTDDLAAPLSDEYNPLDTSVTGVRLAYLGGWDIASLITCGAANHLGISFSVLEHLVGYGITGTFVDLVNLQHVHGRNIKAIDANHLLRIGAYHCACQPGNSYFNDLYMYSWAEPSGDNVGKNSDWGIKLDVRDAGTEVGGGLLNYVTVGPRVQVNGFKDATLNRARGNAAVVIEGASSTLLVNRCKVIGTDLEGKWTYGIRAKFANDTAIGTDGFSDHGDFLAGVKIQDSTNLRISLGAFSTVHIDWESTSFIDGSVYYFAYDENEVGQEVSQWGLGVYKVYREYRWGTQANPIYDPIKINGVTFVQLGTSNSYNIQLSESEYVLRHSLTPIAVATTPSSGDKTWNRHDAGAVLMSGATSTQTLPVVDAKSDGVEFIFKSTDSNGHTISGQSGQLIDGAGTYALLAGDSVRLLANFSITGWVVI